MLTFTRRTSVALSAAAMLLAASSTTAAVLYDNGGLNGSIDAFPIGGYGGVTDYAVSDSFVLAAHSTVTAVNFGVWTSPGDIVSTVDWGITTVPNTSSGFLASGTATVINGATSLINFNSSTYAIGTDTFSIGSISLPAGNYYLVLQNVVATNNDPVWWDESDGPSSGWSTALLNLANYTLPGTTGSEAFQILGMGGAQAPEPSTWALMLVGFSGLGSALRDRRKRPAGAHAPSASFSR